MSNPDRLVQRHTELFNLGVRSGDWAPMLAQFTDDAELIFEGAPVGPFSGKAAIAAAYQAEPPDDQIDVLHVEQRVDQLYVAYAWRRAPQQHAGVMALTLAGAKIARLVVIYGATPDDAPSPDERIAQAVRNNARWCDTIGRLHGRPGEFRAELWLNRAALPRFYPNAVTLTGAQAAAAQRSAIQELIAADVPGAWGVKDSFCALDLAAAGFRLLFEAGWLWRAATLPRPDSAIAGLEWSVIRDADALAEWETAWSGAPDNDAPSSQPRIFLPTLLADESIAVIAARQRDQIVAGAIANRTDAVVGISNVFTPEHDDQRCWTGCIAVALETFGDRPLVGYERGRALATARALGFEELGPLRVWLRQPE
jgi:hypothetical protein